MKIVNTIAKGVLLTGMMTALSTASFADGHGFKCKISQDSMAKPGGFPDRALTMIVPYGPAGGSGQVAAAMAKAVTELTKVDINRDHKPGGSGTVGMTAYMAAPADGYNVLEHIDDASSAHALDSSKPNPGKDLIPLVIPAKKKAPKTINETLISGNGKSVFEINSFNIVSPYTPLYYVLFDARAL